MLNPILLSAELGEVERPAEIRSSNEDTITSAEKIMLATETSSKVYKPSTYKETISDRVHSRQWKEAIEEEIQNLEYHQTWEYDHLPADRKTVVSKWVFKVKYASDESIARYKTRLVAQGFS